MTEKQSPRRGDIYYHLDNPHQKYLVLGIHPDATNFERTEEVGSSIRYTQLYKGYYKAGTVWTRELNNFTGNTPEGEKIFTFVRRASVIETGVRQILRR